MDGTWKEVATVGNVTFSPRTPAEYIIDAAGSTPTLDFGIPRDQNVRESMLLQTGESLFLKGPNGSTVVVVAEQHV